MNRLSLRWRFKRLWNDLLPGIPLPVRLPFGGWWLARNDVCSDHIFVGTFEQSERRFVERLLREGMTVLDIGAHHGFYTILASKKVGPKGHVIAFEPSPRERKRLLSHVRLNRCLNVKVEPLALSRLEGEVSLFVVKGRETGCNSLRPPTVSEPTQTTKVSSTTLDGYVRRNGIKAVDFIKLDVEGAELEVLRGAEETLRRNGRPILLVEVQDCRTIPWGYAASLIRDILEALGYRWFSLSDHGLLSCPRTVCYEANLVAIPEERLTEVQALLGVRGRHSPPASPIG